MLMDQGKIALKACLDIRNSVRNSSAENLLLFSWMASLQLKTFFLSLYLCVRKRYRDCSTDSHGSPSEESDSSIFLKNALLLRSFLKFSSILRTLRFLEYLTMIEVNVKMGMWSLSLFYYKKFVDSERESDGGFGDFGNFSGGLNMNSPDAFDRLT